MALTYAQIVEMACSAAKTPGFTEQAGLHLNMVLSDLALNYDFDLMKNETFAITTGSVTPAQGPYPLPADYLRNAIDEIIFTFNGAKFVLFQKRLADFKTYFTGPGISTYPQFFATDMSVPLSPVAYLWPPPNGVYVISWPYQKAHTYEVTPETSTNVPWFPMSSYLIKEVAARLCSDNDDDRASKLAEEARDYLTHYLKMKDDREGYVGTVGLDKNNFPARGYLRPTKQVPF